MKQAGTKNTITRVMSILIPLIGITPFIISFTGCSVTAENTKSRNIGHDLFSMDLTGPVVISVAFDAGGKTVEQWAAAENQIDWDGKDEQPKRLCTAAYAAVELKTYLQKISHEARVIVTDKSADIPADIIIGRFDTVSERVGKTAKPTTPESYTLSSVSSNGKETLVICGFDRPGMLYGTYELLDRLGVRWFGPQTWREVVPNLNRLKIDNLPMTGSPSFTNQRGFHDESKKGTPEMFTWMARNKLNLWSYQEDLYPLQRKLCLLIAGGNHTWKYLLHPTEVKDKQGRPLFEVHPEWFAMVDGERTSGLYQPCVSNEQALDFMLERFIEQISEGPYQHCDIINFWPYDTFKPWCQCQNCGKLGNDTDKYIYTVAKINKGLKRAYAEGRISWVPKLGLCAYEGTTTTEPPTKPVPAEFDYNLNSFTFFPIKRCYAHTIHDTTCTEMNTTYARQFEAWYQSPYKGDIVAGEYYNVSKYESLPLLFYRVAPSDMKYYHHNHARGFNYMHATGGQWGTRTLTNWMMGKLCWDIEAAPEKLLDTYFNEYFGPVAEDMREAFGHISNAYANIGAWRNWGRTSICSRLREAVNNKALKTPFTLDHLQWDKRAKGDNSAISVMEGLEELDAAREKLTSTLAKNMPANVRTRVEEIQWHLRYGDLSYRLYAHMSKTVLLDRSGETDRARAEFDRAKKVAEELKKNEFSPLGTGGNTNWFVKTQLESIVNYYETAYK